MEAESENNMNQFPRKNNQTNIQLSKELTDPESISYISVPRLHQSTALPCP